MWQGGNRSNKVAVAIEDVNSPTNGLGAITGSDDKLVARYCQRLTEEATSRGSRAEDRLDEYKSRRCLGYPHRHGKTQKSHDEENGVTALKRGQEAHC